MKGGIVYDDGEIRTRGGRLARGALDVMGATGVAVLLSLPVHAQDAGTLALRGATVHTAAGPAIQDATILVRDGRIVEVGPDVQVPSGVDVVDLTGRTVIPGMIDNHSHIGFDIRDANESGTTFTPRYRITDVLSPDEEYWADAVDGGVTTIVTGPGSGSVSSGQAVVVKTWGDDLEARILDPTGGLKIAMGAKRPHTGTSMATTSLLREKFIAAREYQAALDRWEAGGQEGPAPARDLDMEVLTAILRGEDRIRAHVHSAHDILAILGLADEFGFDLTLHHATEAYKVADEIAERDVAVVGLPLFVRVGLTEEVMRSPGYLTERGILFAFHTDDPVLQSKHQRYNGALAIRYGMDEQEALRALTINPARIAGVDDRVGSLEPGKDADLVVIDGPWYELTSRVDQVYVGGELAYDRTLEEGR